MKNSCSIKCHQFFRCPDAKSGSKCMYEIGYGDDGDEFLEKMTY
jgi:hypothetical protein